MDHSTYKANIRSATLDNYSFYGARKFTTLFATGRNWTLSNASWSNTLITSAYHWTLMKAG
jgi:hypothetical protein